VRTGPEPLVHVQRVIGAPIEEVFDALTDPAAMAEWFSPEGHARVEAEPHVGGRFMVVMVGRDVEIEHRGTFLEIDPPRRLVFTWSSRFTDGRDSQVAIDLTPTGDGTRLSLVHRLLTAEQAASHAGGWTRILDRLADRVAAHSTP
jgi:uncharacterized protein YndB with AHSA1/START domain